MMKYIFTVLLLIPLAIVAGPEMSRYNVVWNSPSKDATGVMPVGNGSIAAGVYAIENGDLYLLLANIAGFAAAAAMTEGIPARDKGHGLGLKSVIEFRFRRRMTGKWRSEA